jgi:hypothetical protein
MNSALKVLVAALIVVAVVVSIGLYLWHSGGSSKGVEDVIKSYLEVYSTRSEVREKAIEILKQYLSTSGTVLWQSASVSARSSRTIELNLYEDVIYWLSIDVSGSFCINCDIRLELSDSKGNLVLIRTPQEPTAIFGRYPYLRMNFTLSPLSIDPTDTYYLVLDNSYSILTSKTVYVTLKAYYPSYATADDYFKIFAIGYWISKRFTYVSDPHGLEYVASPNQTLKILAGDCDDLAVLLATLYRSVGLDAGVALIDTNGDGKTDHAATVIHLDKDPKEVLRGIAKWASVQRIKISKISYFEVERGIYLIVDPLMTRNTDNPWHIDVPIYRLVKVIK